MNTKVTLCGVELDNPVIPASGTFGFGYEFARWYDINCLGAICVKGATGEERFGNEQPRIAETASGLLNAVGLQNPGIEAVLSHELPELRKVYKKPVIANISGFSKEEYVSSCRLAGENENVDIIELNISCPNVHAGGMSFGTDPRCAGEITEAVKAVCAKPLIVKLTPNVTDIAAIARACEASGADGVSLINTMLGMKIDLKTKKPLLANRTGGLSGPAVLPVAVRMVWQVYEAVSIPVVGMGGVSSAEDVLEMMLAGAAAVQVGAANLKDPFACRDIIAALPGAMKKYGIDDLSKITGGAH